MPVRTGRAGIFNFSLGLFMISLVKRVLLLLVLITASFSAYSASDADAEARAVMERLASKALSESLEVLQTQGAIYPFELLLDGDDKVHLVGYSGEEEKKPVAADYAYVLITRSPAVIDAFPGIVAAAVAKMHSVVGEDGKEIPGVWILVDHKDMSPWIVFQPLIPGDKPQHFSLGEQIYEVAKTPLFSSKK